MFAFTTIAAVIVPVDAYPVDVVPSAFEALLVPICEGIVVGLVLGSIVMFVMSTIDRLLARPAQVPASELRPTVARQARPCPPATSPAIAPRSVKCRMELYPTPQYPIIVNRLT
jgi:hypothetical protein